MSVDHKDIEKKIQLCDNLLSLQDAGLMKNNSSQRRKITAYRGKLEQQHEQNESKDTGQSHKPKKRRKRCNIL